MNITFRTYRNDTLFGEDYHKLRQFLIELDSSNYAFGRWDWMITHPNLKDEIEKIGIWEDRGHIAALATFDTQINGKCYFPYKQGYTGLLRDMIMYAKENLAGEDGVRVLIRDGDEDFQSAASELGFIPTQEREYDAVIPIDNKIRYTLPEGFGITSIKDNPDYLKYGKCLWKGFNHEANGEGAFEESLTPEHMPHYKLFFERPNVNPDIKIAVTAPNGDFVSYCGMWQDPGCKSVLVEPVATDPAYRKMGLGRAAVLEAVRRCGGLGAQRAFVGSKQQFYYSIGFRPYASSTFWKLHI